MSKQVAKVPTQKTWVRYERNLLLFGDEQETWWISYNPGNYALDAFRSDTGGSETAIFYNGEYYILNGDFRKEYEVLIDKGFEGCKKFFDSKPELHSSWSA